MSYGSLQAASVTYDFNSDPSSILNFGGTLWDKVTASHTGSANWRTSGGAGPVGGTTNGPVKGVNGDGFLQLTFATTNACGTSPVSLSSSLSGCVLFDDFDKGLVTAGFTFEADLRIGNGNSNPADGFSINYVRNTDPVLVALLAGDTFPQMNGTVAPSPNGGQFSDNGSGGDDSLMEEGTQTGLSIGFDMWDSGGYTIPPTSPAVGTELPGITHDGIGLDIRVDGVVQTTIAMPNGTTQATSDEHGNALTSTDPNGNNAATDPTAIETGPYDGTGCDQKLSWVHMKVVLDTNGVLNVFWKNRQILTNYHTAYFPSPGRLILASRVGGNTANIELDNVQITTIAASVALVGAPTGFINGFDIQIGDSGSSTLDTNQPVALTLNGATVTPTSVTKTGGTTIISYRTGGFPNILGSGSTNTVTVVAKDTNGNSINSGPRSFVAPTYGSIPGGDAVTGVDTTKPGFRMLPWESGAEPNRVYWANEQLVGLHGANNADLSGATDSGYADYTGLINFNINPASAGGSDAGQFRTTNGYPDLKFPGIPGSNGRNGSAAEEILTFLQFQAPGVYQMGVDSDDGFALTEGKNPRDRFAQVLGQFDGGRGEGTPTVFTFVVTNAGTYPFRLVWFNGNGELPGNGAGLEWFTIESDGTKILLNDPAATNTSGVKAFFSGPALPAFVSQVNPYPGQAGHLPGQAVVQLTDGGTKVNANSITFQVDGSSTPAATINTAGSVTTATLSFNPLLAPGAHTATLVWSDNGTTPLTHSNTWSFSVMTYTTVALDPGLSVPASKVDKAQPGLNLEVSQLDPAIVNDSGDSLPTQSDSMNALLAGLYFPWYGSNVADVLSSTAVNGQPYTNNFWIWTNALDFNIVTSGGDFGLDYGLPGIPGVTGSSDNLAAAFDSWVIFPSAGYYILGVNSDDGFRLSEGQGVTRQALHVTGAAINTDVAAVVSGTNWGNPGFGANLPLTPISAPVMFVNSNNYTPGGSINLIGKIALVDNGLYGVGNDALLAYIAQTNGAVGFIEINNATNGLPYVMTGSAGAPITIPALNVNGDFGQRDWWLTNGALTASIGADANLTLNSADYGKGLSHQDQVISVPVAGAYPLHLLYFQGGGGAGLEWSILNNGLPADGVRSLINDPTDPASLLAYLPTAAQSVAKPTVSISNQSGTLKINFTGTLQSSPTVNGTYQNVPGVTSPYTVPTGSAPAQFYRSH